jgi:hypothetical protein
MFTWKDDPFSTVTGPTARVQSGDTTTYSGFQVVNESGHTLHDVGVWVPYLEVALPQPTNSDNATVQITHEALTWDNSQHGWFTPNFIDASGNATGESLLLTAQLLTGSSQTTLAAGNVANASGHQQYPLSSEDFLKGAGKWQPETIQTNDLLPFSDIGTLAAGQSKSFSIAITAHWGGADMGAVRAGGWIASLVPNTDSVNDSPTAFHGSAFSG